MRRGAGRPLLILALVIGWATSLAAQEDSLARKLDPATAAAVERTIAAARAAGLPVAPLVAKALEGATKRAPGPRIVEAVQAFAAALAQARDALGSPSGANDDDLVAGANALGAGVVPAALADLRAARRNRSITVPLVVLGDLVARAVPPHEAARLMLAACRAGVPDAELLLLRDRIQADIEAGAPPASAAQLRLRAILGAAERPRPGAPKPEGPP